MSKWRVTATKTSASIRVVCVSDTHSHAPMRDVPPGDVLIHAGDFTSTGRHKEVARFAEWFGAQPHAHKVVVAGNHDLTFDRAYYAKVGGARFGHRKDENSAACRSLVCNLPRTVYLENSGVEILGLKIWGSPVSPTFFDWAFNVDRGAPIAKIWSAIPDDVDVLVTHGPPLDVLDLCPDGSRVGCADLARRVGEVRPALHVFGHIHHAHGTAVRGNTMFVNASICTEEYRPTNDPICVDLIPS